MAWSAAGERRDAGSRLDRRRDRGRLRPRACRSLADDHHGISGPVLDRADTGVSHARAHYRHRSGCDRGSRLCLPHVFLPTSACASRSWPMCSRCRYANLSPWFVRYVRVRLWFAADFACAARRYWLAVFPRVAREVSPAPHACRAHPRPGVCAVSRSRPRAQAGQPGGSGRLCRTGGGAQVALTSWMPSSAVRRSATTWICSASSPTGIRFATEIVCTGH